MKVLAILTLMPEAPLGSVRAFAMKRSKSRVAGQNGGTIVSSDDAPRMIG